MYGMALSGTAKQKLERGEALKRLGNKLLKEGRARRAEVKYAAGVEMFTVMGAEFVHLERAHRGGDEGAFVLCKLQTHVFNSPTPRFQHSIALPFN